MLNRREFITGIGAALIVMQVQGFRMVSAITEPSYSTFTTSDILRMYDRIKEREAKIINQWLEGVIKELYPEPGAAGALGEGME